MIVDESQSVLSILLCHDILGQIVQMVLFLLQLKMKVFHRHLLAVDVYEVQVALLGFVE